MEDMTPEEVMELLYSVAKERKVKATMGIDDKRLRAFVRESNAIEGITRTPTKAEVDAHRTFLKEGPSVGALVNLVAVLQPDAVLRDHPKAPGVRVGKPVHVAPPSGIMIRAALEGTILAAKDPKSTPYAVHVAYETLHPFTDGNGRSGRALWLWQMLERKDSYWTLGFLHAWYYQSLSGGRRE